MLGLFLWVLSFWGWRIVFLLFLSYLSNAFRQLLFFFNPDFLVVTRKRVGLLNATLPLLKAEILGIQFENLFYKQIVFSTQTFSIISRIKCFEIRIFFPLEALIIQFGYLHEYYMKNKKFLYKMLVSDLNIYLLKNTFNNNTEQNGLSIDPSL